MALLTTYNGWLQALPSHLTRVHVGGMSAQVRAGDVATVLGAFLVDFAREVEPIARLYGWRSIATNTDVGGDPRSTHLSGTAVDVNGHMHPWEKRTGTAKYPARGGFTTKQLAALRKVLARYDGVVRWGGDYPKGQRDAMHFDIRANAATVAALAARIRSTEEDDMPYTEAQITQMAANGVAVALGGPQSQGYLREQVRIALHGLLVEAGERSTPTGRQVGDALRAIVAAPAAGQSGPTAEDVADELARRLTD